MSKATERKGASVVILGEKSMEAISMSRILHGCMHGMRNKMSFCNTADMTLPEIMNEAQAIVEEARVLLVILTPRVLSQGCVAALVAKAHQKRLNLICVVEDERSY